GQEDDRNGRSNFLGGAGNQGVIRNDDLNLETKEFFSQRWQPLRPALSVPVLDKDGFVLDVAQVPQPLAKSFKSGGPACAGIGRRGVPAPDTALGKFFPPTDAPRHES